jgi:hypothetical protein
MKTSKYIIALLVLLMSACSVEDPNPMELENVEYGAILRTIAEPSGSYRYDKLAKTMLPNQKYQVILEEDDPQRGKLLGSVDVFIKHRRGAAVTSEVKLRTIAASEFTADPETKLPRTTVTVTAEEAKTALGLTDANLEGGDAFEIRFLLTLTDGRTFTNANASEPIRGTAFFASPFLYRATVACNSTMAGTHTFSTTNITAGAGGSAGACGGTVTGTVTFEEVAGKVGVFKVSDVSFGQFGCAWDDTPPGGSVLLNDACGKLSFSGIDKYGDSYSISGVTLDGNKLTFTWENTYGDSGVTTITKESGNWALDLR